MIYVFISSSTCVCMTSPMLRTPRFWGVLKWIKSKTPHLDQRVKVSPKAQGSVVHHIECAHEDPVLCA